LKRSEAKKSKRNEVKEAKQKYCKRKNILKQNVGKTASIYFRFDAKQKY
jgi:hypothetical protein